MLFGVDDIKERIAATQDGVAVSAATCMDTRARKIYLKNLESHYQRADSLEEAVGGKLPARGEQYRIITQQQFNAFAALLLILRDRRILEMYLAIYRINQPTVHAMIEFIDQGMIHRGKFVISNFFKQTKRPEKWARTLRRYVEGHPRFEHAYIQCHAKILAVRTDRDEHLVLEGSGNMSNNAKVEQYLFENNPDSFAFHRDWICDTQDHRPS